MRFNNKNVVLPEPQILPLPTCVCNYNAVNYSNGEWAESNINSIERRTIIFDNSLKLATSLLSDTSGTYLYKSSTSDRTYTRLTYNSVGDNPFNILQNSNDYPFTFTFVCKGRMTFSNRGTNTSGWSKFNNFIKIGLNVFAFGTPIECMENKPGTVRNNIYDDIICLRLENNMLSVWNVTTNEKSTPIQFSKNVPSTTDRLSNSMNIFSTNPSTKEGTATYCYWWFYSQDVKTDNEVMQVVNYNNSINHD